MKEVIDRALVYLVDGNDIEHILELIVQWRSGIEKETVLDLLVSLSSNFKKAAAFD